MIEPNEAGLKEPLAVIDRVLLWLSASAIFAMTVMITGSVLSRALLGRPLPDSDGLGEMLNAIAVFLALGYVQLMRGHVEVTITTDWMKPRAIERVKTIALVISALCVAALTIGMAIGAYRAWLFDDVYVGEYDLPTWQARMVTAFGAAIFFMRLVIQLFLQFRSPSTTGA